MKTVPKMIIVIMTISLISQIVIGKSHKKYRNKYTPKAIDLNNHFGAPNIGSNIGPSTSYDEHVEKNPDIFTPHRFNGWKKIEALQQFKPFPGWENKLNPHQLKSGEFKNIAPTANGIVNPEITGPKVHIQAEIKYPAHVKMPTFYGFKREYQPVSAYDREEGRIIHDRIISNRPQIGWEDRVSTIKRDHEQFINLNSGENIKYNTELVNHGINMEEPKPCDKKRRFRRFR